MNEEGYRNVPLFFANSLYLTWVVLVCTIYSVWAIRSVKKQRPHENGEIYTGFCIESCGGVLDLYAERTAALNMYTNSGQTVSKRLIAFRDKAPFGEGSGMPCGACKEFLMQLNLKNKAMEMMVDYEKEKLLLWKNFFLIGGECIAIRKIT